MFDVNIWGRADTVCMKVSVCLCVRECVCFDVPVWEVDRWPEYG